MQTIYHSDKTVDMYIRKELALTDFSPKYKGCITLISICILILSIMVTPVFAEDWAMYRKDLNNTGFSDEDMYPPFDLFWKYKTGSYFHSSPAIYDGLVYAGSDDNILYALDVNNGDVRWKYKTESAIGSTPTITDEMIYISSYDDRVYAYEKSGKLKWKCNVIAGFYSSPALYNGSLFLGTGANSVTAIDQELGNVKWEFATRGPVYSSAAISADQLVIGCDDQYVYSLDTNSGSLLWKYYTGGRVRSSPALSDGKVFIGSDDHKLYALDMDSGKNVWSFETHAEVVSSPAVTNDVVVFGSYDNNVYALNTTSGEMLWQFATEDKVRSSPVIINDSVFIGSDDTHLYCLDINEGDLKWKYRTDDRIMSSLAYSGENLYVLSEDGNLYAFTSLPSAASIAIKEANELINAQEAMGMDVSYSRTLLLQAREAFSQQEYERALYLAGQSKVYAEDIDHDNIPNEEDLLPSFSNYYAYIIASGLVLMIILVVLLQHNKTGDLKENARTLLSEHADTHEGYLSHQTRLDAIEAYRKKDYNTVVALAGQIEVYFEKEIPLIGYLERLKKGCLFEGYLSSSLLEKASIMLKEGSFDEAEEILDRANNALKEESGIFKEIKTLRSKLSALPEKDKKEFEDRIKDINNSLKEGRIDHANRVLEKTVNAYDRRLKGQQ